MVHNTVLNIGTSTTGERLTWGAAANFHAYISGCSGTGKSYSLRKLIRQLPELGVRCIVLDASNDWAGLATSPVLTGGWPQPSM